MGGIGMDKANELRAKAVSAFKEFYYNDANWRLHLAYLMADIISSHFKYIEEDMEFLDKELRHSDRYHLRQILRLMKSVQFHAEALYKQSIFTGGAKESYIYESWSLIFQALFLKICSVTGTDGDSNIRLYNLYQKLDKYPKIIDPREMGSIEDQAWGYLEKLISEGKITKAYIDEIFKNQAKGFKSKRSKDNA